MNKLIKTCVIGGIIWASAGTAFHMGKGYMLGLLCAYEGKKTPSDVLYVLSNDGHKVSKFIAKSAENGKRYCERKIEL